ncbi:phytoene/squalene synthase family protein [Enhygromyxa salina]|uniref:All-trans-phytoene synthase n=1 Tax=Enhygromyxa salina TaxID=215803 RepID=A0A2S9YQG1_9BACT|nr:squalene/phytoene synthase family protein [Enhygromyxa salina]PRQ07320.1 All-trans-phytoene synthase [Enhygromyxa salina]
MALPLDVQALVERAQSLMRRVTARSSSNFKFAFLFLSPAQRDALTQVYQFCRVVDDIVDERPPGAEGRAQAEAELAAWSQEVAHIYERSGPIRTDLGQALAGTIEHFALPRYAFDEIIAGCAMDLDITTYPDLESLELYCYRVASCVGILCIGIFGDQSELAQRYAKHLGLALQYTNILRDVGEDAARGRVYLPIDLLTRHGLSEEDALRCTYDRRFLAMAQEFHDIAESEYQKAWAELPNMPNLRPLLPAEIMGRTYHQLLAELRSRRFDVFTHRAALRRRDKLKVAAISLALTSLPLELPGARAVRSVLA